MVRRCIRRIQLESQLTKEKEIGIENTLKDPVDVRAKRSDLHLRFRLRTPTHSHRVLPGQLIALGEYKLLHIASMTSLQTM